jgi:hypothetical protein
VLFSHERARGQPATQFPAGETFIHPLIGLLWLNSLAHLDEINSGTAGCIQSCKVESCSTEKEVKIYTIPQEGTHASGVTIELEHPVLFLTIIKQLKELHVFSIVKKKVGRSGFQAKFSTLLPLCILFTVLEFFSLEA